MTAGSIWNHVSTWAWGDIGTWVGTGIAAVSAAVSWRKAQKASGAATDAEKIRDEIRGEIANRSAHGELSGLNALLNTALQAMEKYAPESAWSGANWQKDAAHVRAFINEMKRLRAMLDTKLPKNVTDQVITNIEDKLDNFGKTPDSNDKASKGYEIYREISAFKGNIKGALDKHIFG
jgi:hypothetical protein